jgi:UDP-N-acetylglucosamine--N-acetylmuramyl-(pentapeptide) pyrophosphoryl-undecaprenol N-acetylglucosamine transferase
VKALIAAGGTGGHILPAIALGEAIRRNEPGSTVDFLCGQREVEQGLYAQNGIAPVTLPARQLGVGLSGRAMGLWAALRNLFRAYRLIVRNRYDVVVGMGGYVAGPAVLAGILARKPTAIHEANSVPGKTNRVLSRWVDLCAVNFEAAGKRMKARRTEVVGMPIRQHVLDGSREEAVRFFRMDGEKRTLLVVGGSQGARYLYQTLMEALPILDEPEHGDVQILWSTGTDNFEALEGRLRTLSLKRLDVRLHPFITRMELALAVADVAVSRAGASTIAELLASGIYALYVPLPGAIYDHQTLNARDVVAARMGDLVPERDLTPATAAKAITSLLEKAGPGKRMTVEESGFHRLAAERLAALLEGLVAPVPGNGAA